MEDPREGNFYLIAHVECVLSDGDGCMAVILLHPPCCSAQDGPTGTKWGPGVFVGLQAQPEPFRGLNTRICFVLPLLHFLLDTTERLLVIFSHPELVREREFEKLYLERLKGFSPTLTQRKRRDLPLFFFLGIGPVHFIKKMPRALFHGFL